MNDCAVCEIHLSKKNIQSFGYWQSNHIHKIFEVPFAWRERDPEEDNNPSITGMRRTFRIGYGTWYLFTPLAGDISARLSTVAEFCTSGGFITSDKHFPSCGSIEPGCQLEAINHPACSDRSKLWQQKVTVSLQPHFVWACVKSPEKRRIRHRLVLLDPSKGSRLVCFTAAEQGPVALRER